MKKIVNYIAHVLLTLSIAFLFLLPSLSQARVFWVIPYGNDNSIYLSDIIVNEKDNLMAAYWFVDGKVFRIGEWMFSKGDLNGYVDWGDNIYQKFNIKDGYEYISEDGD